MSVRFPFSAIAGQDELKLALLLTAVDPMIGGLLALGDRGTGKSTAVRALAALLPDIKATTCAYHCDPASPQTMCDSCRGDAKPKTRNIQIPVVDLPLGATEDRVIGALNLERALSHGEKAFEPGLLASANRGYLYVDEVNLLEDHIVDLLLDVAASGENVVEREGLSVRHPARFVLVGSGNPEEGELRPQLLDRFGLSVEVKTPQDLDQRVLVIKRRDAFERDPEAFREAYAADNEALRNHILKARKTLDKVVAGDDLLRTCAQLCQKLGTDGLRAELTLMRASRAFAAIQGKKAVTTAHLRAIAPLALRHRLRRNPLDDTGSGTRVQRALEEVLGA
ncbi:MAG: magnesium chelatase ATPase subunit I [Alphaproteobacteria bacterium]|nr:magnesium chelatase ATPase subunit I [Alphaproteobacteria bacterium]